MNGVGPVYVYGVGNLFFFQIKNTLITVEKRDVFIFLKFDPYHVQDYSDFFRKIEKGNFAHLQEF